MSMAREQKPMQVRKACGHYAPLGESCPTCEHEGSSPDPWDVVQRDEYRDTKSRMYRQSKYRNVNNG